MIESSQNQTFRKLLSLTTSKGLKEEGLFLLSGDKLVREFLARPSCPIKAEVRLASRLPSSAAEQIVLEKDLFRQLDVLGTDFNLLVLEQPKFTVIATNDLATYRPKGIEVVLPLGDPSNLGALIRSCEAFGVKHVILAREAAHPYLPKAVKASAGSVLRVPLSRGPSLKDFPPTCIALDANGTPVDSFTWPQNGLLLVGEEGPGIGDLRFERSVSIPTSGVESLNAVVAASVVLSRIPKSND